MAARDWRDRQQRRVCRDCGRDIEPKRLAAGMRCCHECAKTRADDVAARRLRNKIAAMTPTDQTPPTPTDPVVKRVAPPRAGDMLLLIVRGDGIGPPSVGWSAIGVVQGFTLSSMTVTQADLDANGGAAPGISGDIPIREVHLDGGDALELGRRAAAVAAEVLGQPMEPADLHGIAVRESTDDA